VATRLQPNSDRLQRDWESLCRFTEPGRPYTRRAFTDLFLEARTWLRSRMEEAGLTVRIDEAGNLIGRREGARPDLPPLMLGSHTDTVAGGGRFDGPAGVLGALEVARVLAEQGIALDHPLEVADFLSEEPSEYQGVSTVGSRGLVGALAPGMLAATNAVGEPLREAIARMGGRSEALAAPRRRRGDVHVYLELHIEQGPVLEAKRIPVGLVTGIVGIRRFTFSVGGRPDHAGTAPMDLRRDALAAASELVLGLEAIARGEPGAVGTVGTLNLTPNAPNVVPGRAEAVAEVRSVSVEALNRMTAAFRRLADEVSARRHLPITVNDVSATAPVVVPDAFLGAQEEALAELGLPTVRLVSGAGHDTNQLATIAPAGMFFIACRDGRSHCPEEWSDLADWAAGVHALALAAIRLDKAEFS
jgi:beta-ureidopropionase / N-carbamoyl-L-amino-acid hydrolase